jgi:hypothetical protein
MRAIATASLAFTGAAAAAFLLTSARPADAYFGRRSSAIACRAEDNSTETQWYNSALANHSSGINAAYHAVVCGVVDGTDLTHDTVTLVNVHGYAANPNATAIWGQACVSYYNFGGSGAGGTCGPTLGITQGFYGAYTLSLNRNTGGVNLLSAWQYNPYHWAYLYVMLPAQGSSSYGNGGYSTISGFYWETST